MPKYGIHHIVMREAATQLAVSTDPAAVSAAGLIRAELPSAVIGAVGPDLFFWGPDYEIVDKLYRLYGNIEEVVAVYNRVVEPIRQVKDAVGEATEAVVGTLAPNTLELVKLLLAEVRQAADLFKSALGANLLSGVLAGVDLLTDAAGLGPASRQFFQLFVPDAHHNRPERDWYWFDMLHYRRSGAFAQSLVEAARSNRQKAFAYGYLSHVATDVVGHPYVNQIVGSPYRLNVQRHVTAENFQDAWKYRRYYGGESINQTLLARMGLPPVLPADVGDQLNAAFRAAYGPLPAERRPARLPGDGFYARAQIDTTYDVFYKVLKLMESMAVERPTEPFSGAADILADALDAFTPPPSPPATSSSSCGWEDILSFGLTESSRECYENFFEEVADWLSFLGELLVWTLETLRNLIDLVLSLLLSLPICVLLALLYGIQLLCYQAYRTARLALSTNGFVMPEPDELETSIGRNLITLADACVWNFKNFPSRGVPEASHLVCPTPMSEDPKTSAGEYARGIASTPDLFIEEAPFDEAALCRYAAAAVPAETRSLAADRLAIGNATDFTAWMIRHAHGGARPEEIRRVLFRNWNLDSDRGYGYKAWLGTVPHAEPFAVEDEAYIPD
jgi:hypothetical protein